MNLTELQPYLTAISAGLGVTTLVFLLNLLKAVRENAQDRIAVQEDRLKRAAEDQQRTEKWAKRNEADLTDELNKAKAELDALLKREGVDLNTLSLGKQLSDSALEVRATTQALVDEMKSSLARLAAVEKTSTPKPKPGWELSLAMGTMAAGSFADAAAHFDAYAKDAGESWQAHFSRGVAHANTRGGRSTDLASLRAYNEAIALAPDDIEANRKARLFAYRGAMLKRLGRLQEAESDIRIALSLAVSEHEVLDARYNLACIHAMRGERQQMFEELTALRDSKRYLRAIAGHMHDYFVRFATDPELLALIRAK